MNQSYQSAVEVFSAEAVDLLLDKLKRRDLSNVRDQECDCAVGLITTMRYITGRLPERGASVRELCRTLGLKRAAQDDGADAGGPRQTETAGGRETDADCEACGVATGDDGGEQARQSGAPPAAGPHGDETSGTGRNRDSHGRRPAEAFGELAERHHAHPQLTHGCHCPDCHRGRLYNDRPDQFTIVQGRPVLTAERQCRQTLRCNLRKRVYKAPLPPDLVADGANNGRLYTHSAVAAVAISKCFGASPWHRQENVQLLLGGVYVPDSSMWGMRERLADTLVLVKRVLEMMAANAPVLLGDDTNNCILEKRSEMREQRLTRAITERTGCHTPCVLAVTAEGHRIALFSTGIHHTGEVMDSLLDTRDPALPPPVFVSDGSACNKVTTCQVFYAGCNAHVVCKLKELAKRYPQQAGELLRGYKRVYDNEEHCKKAEISDEQRRAYHRQHSRPVLRSMCQLAFDLLEQRRVEPNSDLGAVLEYLMDNYRKLLAFTRHAGIPPDNNEKERELRFIVRLRDNAPFFKTEIGAQVSDTIFSVGVTAGKNGANPMDYFIAVQRHRDDVRAHPELWVPWRYRERLAVLETDGLAAEPLPGRGQCAASPPSATRSQSPPASQGYRRAVASVGCASAPAAP